MILAEKSVGDLFSVFQQQLQPLYPAEEIRSMLFRLFEHHLGWSRADVHLKKATLLNEPSQKIFENALEQLHRSVPIQYIIGSTKFLGLSLRITPAVLIPRPETEELAALVIQDHEQMQLPDPSFLDIGTGSGCLALAIKDAFRHSGVTAIDNSQAALEIAMQNASKNQLCVDFRRVDILHTETSLEFTWFNTIISNPPYIPESDKTKMHANVLDHEPASALFVPDENPLLFYQAIADFSMKHLKHSGILYVEIHERFGQTCVSILKKAGFQKIDVLKDMQGKDRFIRASI
ncbi:MAG: peptide chain release factor N(5)-glutamine methyltransferase [Bacteroidales bacterium]|nr:peptide chain release factor N(5)-glutamine methyltransferase [Bacteroidota bacterium]MBL6949411.1 peptide chain release factor N(5)-glutamine methyltransferase [Bacteroidales bacterium]